MRKTQKSRRFQALAQAVILAGGKGTRLRPLTDKIPKVMAPVCGRPFLSYLVGHLRDQGVQEILLCVGYRSGQVRKYFKDGRKFGVRIRYSEEKRLRGTAGALKKAEKMLDPVFLLLNGDTFLPISYARLERFFTKERVIGGLVLTRNKGDDSAGGVSVGRDGLVSRYQKGSCRTGLGYLDAGVGIYKKEILRLFPRKPVISLEKDVYPVLIRRQVLAGCVSGKNFYDIGTPERLRLFEKKIERGMLPRASVSGKKG
ncbi:MAG: sugar phosphate nucleotidyltransferase [Candidatus Omnitrophota bacterium]